MDKLPVSKLKAFAKQHGVSLDGCLEKSHIVDALERAGVQEDGTKQDNLDDAMSAKASGDGGAAADGAPKDGGERGEFESKVMLCEKDGSLKTDDLLKLKTSVGCSCDDDAWCVEFEALVVDQGVLPQDGLSIAAVMALANTTKERLDKKVALEETLLDPLFGGAGAPPPKKAKIEPKLAPAGKAGMPAGMGAIRPPPFFDPRQALPSKVFVKKEVVKCDACEKRPPAAATVHCVNCKVFLCDKCNEENHPTKLLKGHIRVPADSVAEGAAQPAVTPSTAQPNAAAAPAAAATGFASKKAGELKKLAQYHGVKTAGCFEKEDFIAALRAANIPEEGAAEPKPAVPKPVIPPVAERAKFSVTPGVPTKPDGTPVDPETAKRMQAEAKARQERWEAKKREEQAKVQESRAMYEQVKADFPIGSMWDLMSGIALWRNDFGWDRLFFINANKVNGWPNTIEVVQHGNQRMKVRGMQWEPKTNLLKGIPWQCGWLDIASIVDRGTGQLMLKKAKLSAEQSLERDEKAAKEASLHRMAGERATPMAMAEPAVVRPPSVAEVVPEPVSSETASQRWGRFNKPAPPEPEPAAAPQPAPKPKEEKEEPQLFGGIGESEY